MRNKLYSTEQNFLLHHYCKIFCYTIIAEFSVIPLLQNFLLYHYCRILCYTIIAEFSVIPLLQNTVLCDVHYDKHNLTDPHEAADYTLRTTGLTGKLLVASINIREAVLPTETQRPKHKLSVPAVPAPHALRMTANKRNYTASRPRRPQSSTQCKSVGNILLRTNTFTGLCLDIGVTPLNILRSYLKSVKPSRLSQRRKSVR
jgi:hypothetical protein